MLLLLRVMTINLQQRLRPIPVNFHIGPPGAQHIFQWAVVFFEPRVVVVAVRCCAANKVGPQGEGAPHLSPLPVYLKMGSGSSDSESDERELKKAKKERKSKKEGKEKKEKKDKKSKSKKDKKRKRASRSPSPSSSPERETPHQELARLRRACNKLRCILWEFPAIRRDLRQLLWTIDSGQGVNLEVVEGGRHSKRNPR